MPCRWDSEQESQELAFTPCGSHISNLGSETWVQVSLLHSSNFKDQSRHNNIDRMPGILIKVGAG